MRSRVRTTGQDGSSKSPLYEKKAFCISLCRRNKWSVCPAGYFLNGLYRTSGEKLNNIEEGKCCKPVNHPAYYEDCYDDYIRTEFDKKGWTLCRKIGYYIVGLFHDAYKDWLHNIDYFRCCKMWTGTHHCY